MVSMVKRVDINKQPQMETQMITKHFMQDILLIKQLLLLIASEERMKSYEKLAMAMDMLFMYFMFYIN